MRAPVALFVYNRPQHTKATVAALRANDLAAQTPLYIFSDAPKTSDHADTVAAVRELLRDIQGFKSVTVLHQEENQGLAASITQGVTMLCHQAGHVIVLEDDLCTSPHFLTYMNEALARYANHDQVMQISGHMFDVVLPKEQDAFFLPYITSWGWATWSRAWTHYDEAARDFQKLRQSRRLRYAFDLGGTSQFYKMLKHQQQGRNQSWAIRWYLSVFMRQGLTLCPQRTLVENIGFDGSGEHCQNIETTEKIDAAFKVRVWPDKIACDRVAYERVRQYYIQNRQYHHAVQHTLETLFNL